MPFGFRHPFTVLSLQPNNATVHLTTNVCDRRSVSVCVVCIILNIHNTHTHTHTAVAFKVYSISFAETICYLPTTKPCDREPYTKHRLSIC